MTSGTESPWIQQEMPILPVRPSPPNFRTVNPFQPYNGGGGSDAFVTKFGTDRNSRRIFNLSWGFKC